MNILIAGIKGTGLGNLIQFIPVIQKLQKQHYVYTNDKRLSELNILPFDTQKPDRIYLPMFPGCWKNFWKFKLEHLFTPIYGFKYRANFGFGYKKAIKVDKSISELQLNKELVDNKNKYKLWQHHPIKNKIIFGTSNKKKCYYSEWGELKFLFKKSGYNVEILGECGKMAGSLRELVEKIKQAEYYIGVDNGAYHIADIINVPGIIIWGRTCGKNLPHNNNLEIIVGLNKKPEYIYKTFEFLKKEKWE